MRALLLLCLAACSAEPPCSFEDRANRWLITEIEDGCALPTLNPIELGCDSYVAEPQVTIDCRKILQYRCREVSMLTLSVVYEQSPERGLYTFRGRDCVTTYTLVPKGEP